MNIESDADRQLAETVLLVFRGHRVSRDAAVAEAAARQERLLLAQIQQWDRIHLSQPELVPHAA